MSSHSNDIPTYIGYAALCLLLLVAGILIFLVWFMKRRRAEAAPDTYSSRAWNRYVAMLQGLEAPSPAAVRLQRQMQNRNGMTLDELNLVAPVRRFGSKDGDENDARDEDSKATQIAPKLDTEDGDTQMIDEDSKESTCAICLDEMEVDQKTRRLPCMHEYHSGCVEEWITKVNRCPVCSREPLETEVLNSRRNARSTRRRGIDAAITRQRRRRERNPQGHYELSTINYANIFPIRNGPEDALDVPEAPLPPSPHP